jgi:hypothetical protein
MNISELIAKLERLKQEHGDLRVVTPGFDEDGFSDVDCVERTYILANVRPIGHCGEHEDAKAGDPNAEPCIYINF